MTSTLAKLHVTDSSTKLDKVEQTKKIMILIQRVLKVNSLA